MRLASFMSGGLMMGFWGVAIFFFRFWRKTGDRFFGWFATAFLMLMVERIALVFVQQDNEVRTYVYFFRLAAFILILVAIGEKNRSPHRSSRVA